GRCFLQSKARSENRRFPDRDGDPATVSMIPRSLFETRQNRTECRCANRTRLQSWFRSDTGDRARPHCCTCQKAWRSVNQKAPLHAIDVPHETASVILKKSRCPAVLRQKNRRAHASKRAAATSSCSRVRKCIAPSSPSSWDAP